MNKCDWDSNACTFAIKNNHLEIFEWAKHNGCNVNYHLCIKYVHKNDCFEIVNHIRSGYI